MKKKAWHRGLQRRLTGITLVETVLSLLILAGAFVAAMNTITSARGSQVILAERRFGQVLAEDLMDEILAREHYKEGSSFGPEADEVDGVSRAGFDDLDDYHGWSASPPVDEAGNAIPGADRYTRKAQVRYVKLWNPNQVTLSDEGMALIVVTVKHGDKQVAELHTFRSDIWQSPGESY